MALNQCRLYIYGAQLGEAEWGTVIPPTKIGVCTFIQDIGCRVGLSYLGRRRFYEGDQA